MKTKNHCLILLKEDRFKVIIAPLLKLFEVFSELTIPFLIKFVIDKGIKNNDWKYILSLIGIMLAMTIAGFIITMIAQYLASQVSSNYSYRLRDSLYQKIDRISEKQLNHYGKDKILTLMNNDAFISQNAVMMFMRLAARPVFLIIGSTILSFLLDYKAGLIYLGVIIFSGITIWLTFILTKKRYLNVQSKQDLISQKSNGVIKGIRVVHAFNKENEENSQFQNITNEYQKESLKISKINALINPLTFFFINLGILLIVYLAKDIIPKGQLTTGEIASFISYLVAAAFALIMFGRMMISLNKAQASNRRINDFLNLEEKKNDVLPDVTFDENAPIIEFKHVYFSYHNNDNYALKDVSFILKKGESLGIIGGTGSGKSTIVSLINKIYTPQQGQILFKGVDISSIPTNDYLSHLSSVLQKPALYQDDISSNIILNQKEDKNKLNKVLKDSLAQEFVEKYDDQEKHPINENGKNLSGGQKQRLLIARSLYHDNELLILDDSTSALDYLSDKKVRENILNSHSNVIFLSQRASTLSSLSHILVIDNGGVIDYGDHSSLYKNCSLYKEICDIQKGVDR